MKEKQKTLYLPLSRKLLSLLCAAPLLFWLLNLVLFAGTPNLVMLGCSLFLLLFSISYALPARVILAEECLYWRGSLDFRLYHCQYTAIQELKGSENFVPGQSIYDFVLLLQGGRAATLSLGLPNSIHLIRALRRKDVRVSPELLRYFCSANRAAG